MADLSQSAGSILSEQDLCFTSLDLLQNKCLQWFKDKQIEGSVHFPDVTGVVVDGDPDQITNVVFFGRFLTAFAESGNWVTQRVRLWVLCESVREVLVQMLGVPRDSVSVIPRYELFGASKSVRPFPKMSEKFTIVFGGRISPTKNIELLIKTAFFLQTELGVDVKLALIGPFDSEPLPDRDPQPLLNYQAVLEQAIQELPWRDPPKVLPKTDPDQWLRREFINPVFASFSSFISEDFGVSVAQAQEQGWPTLLSDWGAHRDVRGTNVVKIPSELVGHSHEPSELITVRARQIAYILKRDDLSEASSGQKESQADSIVFPRVLELNEVDQIRRNFIKRNGIAARHICKGALALIPDTPGGAIFFSKYRTFFSGQPRAIQSVVFVNNFNRLGKFSPAFVPALCNLLMDEAVRAGRLMIFPSIKDFFHLETQLSLMNTREVVLPFFNETLVGLTQNLLKTMSSEVKFTVFCHENEAALCEKTISSKLRSHDQVISFESEASMKRAVQKFMQNK